MKQVIRTNTANNNDYYATPNGVFARLLTIDSDWSRVTLDSCAGELQLANQVHATGRGVMCIDIIDRLKNNTIFEADFLGYKGNFGDRVIDSIINPPFNLNEEFIRKSHDVGIRKLACILPHEWIVHQYSKKICADLGYPVKIGIFTPKISFLKNGTIKMRTGVAFSWYIWDFRLKPTASQFTHI